MQGKEKCKMLKQIRAEIARQNDIDLVIEECTHKGKCKGTCPRCEAEVRYLEAELEKRRSLKKKIALAGISAGLALTMTGCSLTATVEDLIDSLTNEPRYDPEIEELDGDVAMPAPDGIDDIEVMGEVAYMPEENE